MADVKKVEVVEITTTPKVIFYSTMRDEESLVMNILNRELDNKVVRVAGNNEEIVGCILEITSPLENISLLVDFEKIMKLFKEKLIIYLNVNGLTQNMLSSAKIMLKRYPTLRVVEDYKLIPEVMKELNM